nr:trypsin-like peptidase domain-containing protein [Actinomycetota bacterium]
RGATVLGSVRSHTPSAVHRLVLQRSIRRATTLGAAALVVVIGLGALFATGVLPPGGGSEDAVERVVRAGAPGTVLVEAQRDGTRVKTGSGWVLDAGRGLIVTNAHVLNGGTSFLSGTPGSLRPASVVGVAPCEDLAVLRLARNKGLRSLPLGSQSSLALGETVVAMGYPENASQEASLTSTTGVVSIVRSAYREATVDVPRYPNVIQTDAAINPGGSGGPLLDLGGKLVGVNAAGRTIATDGTIVQGQGYAIGVDRVREVTAVLRKGRSLGWLGVGFDFAKSANGGDSGLTLSSTMPATAADRAGLRAGMTLLAVNGLPVAGSLSSYCDAVTDLPSGTDVRVTVRRPGASEPRELAVKLQ